MVTAEHELLQRAQRDHRAGRLPEAAASYRELLAVNPHHAEALYLLGVVAYQTGEHDRAAELIRRATSISPDESRYHNMLGLVRMAAGDRPAAGESFERAIVLEPTCESFVNLGVLRNQQGRVDEAIAAYRQGLALAPGDPDALYNLGNAQRATGAADDALDSFRRALQGAPQHAHALAALGQTLQASQRSAEAAVALERAASLLPDDAGLHCDLGDARLGVGQLEGAITEYRRALQCDPRMARAWYSHGWAETQRTEYAAAAACFTKALELAAPWPEAEHNLGRALFELGHVNDAVHHFRRAAAGPHPELPRLTLAVVIPGSSEADNHTVLEARRSWVEHDLPPAAPARRFAGRMRPDAQRLRIGYVSSFFHRPNWMKPVWALINHHDRRQFEIHLFADSPAASLRDGYHPQDGDHVHEIADRSNDDVAGKIERCGIDVLVDLNGYSKPNRLPLFQLRPAPVVVGWFNMFATTGMPSFDYLIGDDEVIPPEEEQYYCETIVRVPGSYLTFDVSYPVPDVSSAPCAMGGPITFGCLASQYKITSEVIAAWSAILDAAPDSTLVLRNAGLASPGTRRVLHAELDQHGIAPERVHLLGPVEHVEFLRTYGQIDIALDTFPYNGGTTTTEAIWQGVPVVAFRGDRWASRTSASILRAAGLGEFLAADVNAFVSLAIDLARSPATPDRLASVRREMRERLRHSSVCDTKGFARNMERIYRQMYDRWRDPSGGARPRA